MRAACRTGMLSSDAASLRPRKADTSRPPATWLALSTRRRAVSRQSCPACEAEERRRPAPTSRADTGSPSSGTGTSAPPPASEDVWGLLVTRSMCGCRARLRSDVDWANTAGATYASCDTPANPTATAVEACFDAAHPSATVVATTSPSGTITLPPPSADPCERITRKATLVHETMHARHTEAMAKARGTAFFAAWRALAGDPDRLDKLRAPFPAEVAAFEAQWNDGHDWAQDEVNSYRWERRFLVDALAALHRIC